MPNRHIIHRTAALFAVKYTFRLCRKANGFYFLKNNKGADIDTPAWGGDTAAGAIRMMRRHVRLNISTARAAVCDEFGKRVWIKSSQSEATV